MKALSIVAIYLCALISSAFGTTVEVKSLKELVPMASNILGGRITAVRMVDGKGRKVTDPNARTGPGLKNQMFFDVAVDSSLILRSNLQRVPARISIPLDRMSHDSLGVIKRLSEGEKFIFLLTDNFEPAYPARYERSLDDEKIRALIQRSPRK